MLFSTMKLWEGVVFMVGGGHDGGSMGMDVM